MKMKEFGPPGGARVPGAPPLDPPLVLDIVSHLFIELSVRDLIGSDS